MHTDYIYWITDIRHKLPLDVADRVQEEFIAANNADSPTQHLAEAIDILNYADLVPFGGRPNGTPKDNFPHALDIVLHGWRVAQDGHVRSTVDRVEVAHVVCEKHGWTLRVTGTPGASIQVKGPIKLGKSSLHIQGGDSI